MENKKENNYKVAFFTLVGMIVGATIVSCIFLFNNKDNTKIESSSNSNIKQEERISNDNIIDNNSNDNNDNVIDNNSNEVSNDDIVEQTNESEYASKESNTSNTTSTSNKSNTNVTSNKTTSNTTNKKVTTTSLSSKDNKVINYLKEKEQKISSGLTKDNAKALFIEVVDFLFYDGEIKGYTFSELTDKGKMEVTELCSKIEIAIEKKYPGAIDETKSKYSEKKEKVIDKYNETINKFCTGREDTCAEFRKGYENMKYSFKNTFNIIKDLGSKGKEKLENWYSNFKNS